MGRGNPDARNTAKSYYGAARTFHLSPPRIVDVALWNGLKPGVEAQQRIPSGMQMGDALPKGASLVGEHLVTGDGVPDSFRFTLGAAQDVIPAIELQSRGTLKDSVALSWIPVTNAKGYFLNAMGAQGDDMVFWSSSETPDTGFRLFDFLSNGDIAKWTKEKVLLDASATDCAVPQGIFQPGDSAGSRRGRSEGGAMLRMIAYGGEHGFVHPPRPADPKVPWEQEWSVRLRVKSQTMAMLGQEGADEGQSRRGRGMARPQQPNAAQGGNEPPAEKSDSTPAIPNPFNAIKGLFGR